MLNNASIPVKLMPGELAKAYEIRHELLFASVIFEGGGHSLFAAFYFFIQSCLVLKTEEFLDLKPEIPRRAPQPIIRSTKRLCVISGFLHSINFRNYSQFSYI